MDKKLWKERLLEGFVNTPASVWGVEWAEETFGDGWEKAIVKCAVLDYQMRVKGAIEGFWLQDANKDEEKRYLQAFSDVVGWAKKYGYVTSQA